jgi:hypothetical protein
MRQAPSRKANFQQDSSCHTIELEAENAVPTENMDRVLTTWKLKQKLPASAGPDSAVKQAK